MQEHRKGERKESAGWAILKGGWQGGKAHEVNGEMGGGKKRLCFNGYLHGSRAGGWRQGWARSTENDDERRGRLWHPIGG